MELDGYAKESEYALIMKEPVKAVGMVQKIHGKKKTVGHAIPAQGAEAAIRALVAVFLQRLRQLRQGSSDLQPWGHFLDNGEANQHGACHPASLGGAVLDAGFGVPGHLALDAP